ncbi:protein kinase domain-containing protein [Bacillus cereus]|uniref:protein kinase domain-containing protein n=1 Tax=Bacillus cereus TaxID=1396 RepID=UPI001427B7E0|nr:protein kinase [Bacillus cereus]MBF8117363.1 protein kinase [Bacillus cereus]NIL13603.1 protein kinase [Bacillus cereus]NKW76832.1 protein kinase [Bacillus cereus]HDR6476556.1 protein kinase [Bacillus cereus]HDR8132655.1 protein kinase [Bacillus cereus]
MDPYILTIEDVQEVLQQQGLIASSIYKLPRSGQRQVFEVTFSTGNLSMLKFVDVSPYVTCEKLKYKQVSESAFEIECNYEIKARSQRLMRELNASKKCSILPQLEILEEPQELIKENYHFIYYFETKFEGDTLKNSELYRETQNIDTIIRFLFQLVKQIKVMHESGYVHRDLTPRNIMYYQGEFKIIDAGLVKSNEEEKLTGTMMMIGTRRYMAPEQHTRASDYTWDFRTDLFPLGLIAIEIFLPGTRFIDTKDIRDMHNIYELWKEKDASSKSLRLFSRVISRLAIEQRHKRWADLDGLLNELENMIGQEED